MKKFGFVVLNYNNFEDTRDCILSILNLDYEQKFIFIVDNGSLDDSFTLLKECFENENKIYFISSTINLGFSKGNNLGIQFARSIGVENLCILNNDTIIEQNNFIDLYFDNLDNSKFMFAGPKIISTIDGFDQNPFLVPKHYIKNSYDAFKLFLVGLIKYLLIIIGIKEFWVKEGMNAYSGGLENEELSLNDRDFLLHGSCFFLSEYYFERFDKIIDDTFLYEEETLWYYSAIKLKISLYYFPNIEIYHKESSTTKKVHKNNRKRLIFSYKQDMYSRFKVFLITLLSKEKLLKKLKNDN